MRKSPSPQIATARRSGNVRDAATAAGTARPMAPLRAPTRLAGWWWRMNRCPQIVALPAPEVRIASPDRRSARLAEATPAATPLRAAAGGGAGLAGGGGGGAGGGAAGA